MIYLITGLMASGKSTIVELLAGRFKSLYQSFMRDTPRIGLWIDNSEQAPEETVNQILSGRCDIRPNASYRY